MNSPTNFLEEHFWKNISADGVFVKEVHVLISISCIHLSASMAKW